MSSAPDAQSPRSLARRWRDRFAYAFRGLGVAVRGEENFAVHLPAAAAVVALAWWLEVSRVEWLVLILCIAAVIAAELFNSAIERLARAVTSEENPQVRDALDISAAAVLAAAVGAKVVWVVVLSSRLFY